jgi:hypothetical protein
MSIIIQFIWNGTCYIGRKILNIMTNEELILHELRQVKTDVHRMQNVLENISGKIDQKDGWKDGKPVVINQYYLLQGGDPSILPRLHSSTNNQQALALTNGAVYDGVAIHEVLANDK